MKQLTYLFVLAILSITTSCNSNCKKNESTTDTTAAPVVGGDSDLHGCKASAGYQWSELKQDCIRSFELPLKIISADSTTQTGVVFSADSTQAEMFAPTGHYLLKRDTKGHYNANGNAISLQLNQNGEWIIE